MRLLARVLHSSGIVQNCYAEPAWGSRWINTNEKGRLIYEVADCTTDPYCILPIPQKDGYRAASAISHDPQYATLIYHYGFHAIPVDYITLNRAGAGTTIRVGILYVKIN